MRDAWRANVGRLPEPGLRTLSSAATFFFITLFILVPTVYAQASYDPYAEVRVEAYPLVSRIVVDGWTYLPHQQPLTFRWLKGSTHTISLPSEVVTQGARTRYVFAAWNDGFPGNPRIIGVAGDAHYIALFKTQHHLDVLSPYGSPWGQGWYDQGSIASFGVQPVADPIPKQSRMVFTGWDKGDTPWSANNTIEVTGPARVVAQWKTQYWLQVETSVDGAEVGGSGWYDEGLHAPIFAKNPFEPEGSRVKHTFLRWTTVGPNPARIESDSSASTLVTMDSYHAVRAEWQTLFYVKVESEHGDPEGEGYYPKGGEATVSISLTDALVPGQSRWAFAGWRGDVDSSTAELTVTVDQPKTLIAEWKKQHYLHITSLYGDPEGAGWYDEGSTAAFSVGERVGVGFGRDMVFDGWRGDYTGSASEGSLVMSGPSRLVAGWRLDVTMLYATFGLIAAAVVAFLFTLKFLLRRRI